MLRPSLPPVSRPRLAKIKARAPYRFDMRTDALPNLHVTADESGAIPGAAATRVLLPPAFKPDVPQLPWWRRAWWSLTRRGRIRLIVVRAYRDETIDDSQLDHALEGLPARPADEPTRALVQAVLTCRAWGAIRAKRWARASQAVHRLDELHADYAKRLSLRWQLMRGLLAPGQADVYRAEAVQLASHARTPSCAAAVKLALGHVFDNGGASAAAEVAGAIPTPMSAEPWAAAALAVGQCPTTFDSVDSAAGWARRVLPEVLADTPSLRAAALIIQGRAAEWAGDSSLMQRLIATALKLSPSCDSVRYWHSRAALYEAAPDAVDAPQSTAPTYSGTSIVDASPAWQRLRGMHALRRTPGLDAAAAWLACPPPAASGVGSAAALEAPERDLALRLLRTVMAPSPTWSVSQLARAARLSRRVCRVFGPVDWADATVAFAALRLHDDAARATTRLERWRGVKNACAEAAELAQASQVMAGDAMAAPYAPVGLLDSAVSPGIEVHWWDAVPALAAVRDVLMLAQRVVAGEADAAHEVLTRAPAAAAPTWAQWLERRCRLMVKPIDEPAENAAASLLSEHGGGGESPLGRIVDMTRKRELRVVDHYRSARSALTQGETATAASELEQALRACGDLCKLSRASWLPLLRYWYGVAMAHRRDDDAARAALEAVLPTFMRDAAHAQLALLALCNGAVDAAVTWLDEEPDRCAAKRYARALLAARRGDDAHALELVDKAAAHVAPPESPYPQALRRLRAALLERRGELDAADAAHCSAVETDSSDQVAVARALRHQVRRQYAAQRLGTPGSEATSWEFFATGLDAVADTVDWARPYGALARVASLDAGHASETLDKLDGIQALVPTADVLAPWVQVRCAALVRHGRWTDAAHLLAACEAPVGAETFARSRLIERAHRLLRTLGSSDADADDADRIRVKLQACASELGVLGSRRPDDVELVRWQQLAAEAMGGATGGTALGYAWHVHRPLAAAHVPGLFDRDGATRRAAADAVLAALRETGNGWDDTQSDLAAALSHHARGEADAYLACYRRLEPELSSLPIDGKALWLAAATCWSRNNDWAPLVDREPPECVADLQDAQVRMVLAGAMAQAAVVAFEKGELSRAREHARRARLALEPLCGA